MLPLLQLPPTWEVQGSSFQPSCVDISEFQIAENIGMNEWDLKTFFFLGRYVPCNCPRVYRCSYPKPVGIGSSEWMHE